jgi:arylsulfatase A-like enzyme
VKRLAAIGALILAACSKDAPRVEPGSSLTPAKAAPAASQSPWYPAPPVRKAASRPVQGPPKNANVIMLSVDSLRADMPWNGYPRPIAPRLTELASKAVVFTRAHSVSSYTAMSLGGLLAGRLPSELDRSGYFFSTYRHVDFFPKDLRRAGVHTMGVMAHMYFKSAGFDGAFDDWKIVPGVTFDPNTDRDVTSPQSEEAAEQLLGDPANDSRPFFFWAHFLDPHDLYLSHEGIDWGPRDRDRYDGEVTFTDRYLGKLLDFIASKPWAARTILIITADHGEEFGEHGMTRHGFEVWETLVHVPLLVIAPGATPKRVDALRSAIDLAPTILDVFHVQKDPELEGRSLIDEIYGDPGDDERDVVVDLPATSDSGRRRALIHGTEKLICFESDAYCKLYYLDTDPMELAPTTQGHDYNDMRQRYAALTRTVKETTPYACGLDCLNSAYRKKAAAN